MELRWTSAALGDLDAANEFVATQKPAAAARMAARVLEGVEYLLSHPNLGREGRVRGTRELVISGTPFLVVYAVSHDQIQVLRVLHHARKWP